jgi:tetratricopeptide (TPR) repeat protein
MKPVIDRTVRCFLLLAALYTPLAFGSTHRIRHAALHPVSASKPSGNAAAYILLQRGDADKAIAALQNILAASPQDATTHNLLCRAFYEEHRWPEAIDECQRAVALDPNQSEFHTWLGRSYGEAAEHASLFAAFNLARKVHTEFEAAVQLAPQSVAALSDLGEYAVEAPGFLGGGLDKAERIAKQLQPLSAEAYHAQMARIAHKRKDPQSQERELKLAIAQSPAPGHAWMQLASFEAWRGAYPSMEQAIRSGLAADPQRDGALVDGASILIRHKYDVELAKNLLQMYIASRHTTEETPVFVAEAMLGRLLRQQGDIAGAEKEFAAAHALASGYKDEN